MPKENAPASSIVRGQRCVWHYDFRCVDALLARRKAEHSAQMRCQDPAELAFAAPNQCRHLKHALVIDEESNLFITVQAFDPPSKGGTNDERIAIANEYEATGLADLGG